MHLGRPFDGVDRLIARNLGAIWPNLRAAGARRLVLVRALRDAAAVDELRAALPEADVTVVRLVADASTIELRLRSRDGGDVLAGHLEETRRMAEAMEAAALEDLLVENEGRSVREVAKAVLGLVGWV